MVDDYHGRTYVAYLDISGFTEMMKDEQSAWRVLDKFYQTIYQYCENHTHSNPKMNVILGSDEAIAFARNERIIEKSEGLFAVLSFIRSVNRSFIDLGTDSFTTTCSIAYGQFNYQNRSEVDDLRKNFIFGSPYVKTVLDQKKGVPKIKPGDCRLLFRRPTFLKNARENIIPFIHKRGKRNYFYWMLNGPNEKRDFNAEYLRAYSNRKRDNYRGIMEVLRKYAIGSRQKARAR